MEVQCQKRVPFIQGRCNTFASMLWSPYTIQNRRDHRYDWRNERMSIHKASYIKHMLSDRKRERRKGER